MLLLNAVAVFYSQNKPSTNKNKTHKVSTPKVPSQRRSRTPSAFFHHAIDISGMVPHDIWLSNPQAPPTHLQHNIPVPSSILASVEARINAQADARVPPRPQHGCYLHPSSVHHRPTWSGISSQIPRTHDPLFSLCVTVQLWVSIKLPCACALRGKPGSSG